MEDFEFISFNPMGNLLKKGARKAGSAVSKGFLGTAGRLGVSKNMIPGKLIDPTKAATRGNRAALLKGQQNKIKMPKLKSAGGGHTSTIREAFAPNRLIRKSDRYDSYVNHMIGTGGGKMIKDKMSGPSSRLAGGTRGQMITSRNRGAGTIGTSRRALASAGGIGATGQQIVKNVNQMYSSPIANLISLDAKLDKAIEFSKKPKITTKDLTQKEIRRMKVASLLAKIR